MVRHTVDQLSGSYDQCSPCYLAVVGLLLLRGVTAASRNGDRDTPQVFLAEATEVARYVAFERPDAWANFSPTNVALREVSAAVSFGDAGIALETARPLMRRHFPSLSVGPRSGWRPRAYSQQGRLADGYQALRIAESCAAQDVHCPAVREPVAAMAARDRRRALPELHPRVTALPAPADGGAGRQGAFTRPLPSALNRSEHAAPPHIGGGAVYVVRTRGPRRQSADSGDRRNT
jgi:hypothetical protein